MLVPETRLQLNSVAKNLCEMSCLLQKKSGNLVCVQNLYEKSCFCAKISQKILFACKQVAFHNLGFRQFEKSRDGIGEGPLCLLRGLDFEDTRRR